MTKKHHCKLFVGGTCYSSGYGTVKYTFIHYDENRKVIKGFGVTGTDETSDKDEKELTELAEFINQLLDENKQLKEEKKITQNLKFLE